MTEASAIRASNVGKVFDIAGQTGHSVVGAILGRRTTQQFVALSDISFDIPRGQVVGIIGANGAGKSTLLKLIAGVLKPSSGEIEVNGRVSALLELGSGFNDERTGRENVYVGGLYMGFTREEVDAKFEAIHEFSGIGAFINHPMKIYSSGMKSRLAFALATAVDPEILIIDETLSVGDVAFERKSFARIREFREQGKTILVTTHFGGVLEQIADRALYIRRGRLEIDGMVKPVVARYMRDMFGPDENAVPEAEESDAEGAVARRYGNGGAQIVELGLYDMDGQKVARVVSGQRYQVQVRVQCVTQPIEALNVGVTIANVQGTALVSINPILAEQPSASLKPGDLLEVACEITMNLGVGNYFITVGAWSFASDTHYDRRTDAIHFHVVGPKAISQSLVNVEPAYRSKVLAGAAEALT